MIGNDVKPPLPTRSRELGRKLRRAMTDAESLLWRHLRGSRLRGLKFRRQYPMPPYVVDFYCDAVRLAVEVDGSQHSEQSDAIRTRFLARAGIEVLRFWDNDVLLNIDTVLETILASIQARTLTPTPLPEGEGLKEQPL